MRTKPLSGGDVAALNCWTTKAYTLVELVVTILLLSLMLVSVYLGLLSGFSFVQTSREDLRATQIMEQKMETIRLYNWSQINSNGFATTFNEYYDPSNTASKGTYYAGAFSVDPAVGLPAGYANSMRLVTVRVYWTNYPHRPNTNLIIHSRQMQTFVAHNGMRNYIAQ